MAKLGDICKPNRPRHKPSDYAHLPFIGMEHVESHWMKLLGSVPANMMRSSAVHFWPGDVLYGRLRPYLNKVVSPSFEGLCSAEFIVLPKQEHIENRYVQYFLNTTTFVSFASHLNEGDRPRVDFEQIGEYEIPIPPLAEQRRIVAAIEEQFSRLDAGVASLERARANLKRYRAAVIDDACSGRLIADVSPNTIDSWRWLSLQELNPSPRKSAYGVLQPGEHVAHGTPLIRVGNIANGRINLSDLKRIDPAIAARYPRTALQGGEVLLSLVGTIGRTAIVPASLSGANVARAIAVIPIREGINPHWVSLWLSHPKRTAELTSAAHEVARKTLNLEDVRRALIAVPPIATQDLLVTEVERRFSVIDAMNTSIENSLKRAERLRQAILKRAFAGELVPQDPTDEPASVLLERIRAERASIHHGRAKKTKNKSVKQAVML